MGISSKADRQFDALILGCGSAGTTAAKRLRADGHTVAVVEMDEPGGDCPLRACVPTKALLRSAEIYSLLKRAGAFGIEPGSIGFDWAKVMARKDDIVRQTGTAGAAEKLEGQGIAYFHGEALFQDESSLRVDGQVLRGQRILIATGSLPAQLDIPGLDEVKPITSAQAVSLPTLPASMIIIGGGPVGCEFAHLFSTFGVKVVLLHKGEMLLPREEPELSRVVADGLEENGVVLVAGARVTHFNKEGTSKKAGAEVQGEMRDFVAKEILVATGREARTDTLGLLAAGVATTVRGFVRINDFLQTSQPHIYAAGDVCGPLLYTHFAHYQGRVAAANMFAGTPERADYRVVPRVTFTEPPIAGVGLTEEQARSTGRNVRCSLVKVDSLGKALVESEGRGLVKLVADAGSGEILGGHIAGAAAGEVVHEVVAAMAARATVRDLAEAIHAFPNFAEGIKAAARQWVAAGKD